MNEPLAERAGYFRSKAECRIGNWIGLTAAARAAGSRWDVMAVAYGISTYQELAGVIYRITGQTAAELLFSVTGTRSGRSPAAGTTTRR